MIPEPPSPGFNMDQTRFQSAVRQAPHERPGTKRPFVLSLSKDRVGSSSGFCSGIRSGERLAEYLHLDQACVATAGVDNLEA